MAGTEATPFHEKSFTILIRFDTVLVEVGTGPTKKAFSIHKDVLYAKNSIFTTEPYQPKYGNVQHVVELPNKDPRTFASLVEYLYNGTIPGAREAEEVWKSLRFTQGTTESLLNLIVRLCTYGGVGSAFTGPVAEIWPEYAAAYNQLIANEIDLPTIYENVKSGKSGTFSTLKADLDLLYSNSVVFNSASHPVTRAAETVRKHVLAGLSKTFASMYKLLPESCPQWGYMTGTAFSELCRLIALAERFQFIDLADAGMDAVVKLHRIHHRIFSENKDCIPKIYASTKRGSKLRAYVMYAFADDILGDDDKKAGQDFSGSTIWITEMMQKCPELNLEVIGFLRGKNDQGIGSIFDEPYSTYHQHGVDGEDSEESEEETTGDENNHDGDDDGENMDLCPSQGN